VIVLDAPATLWPTPVRRLHLSRLLPLAAQYARGDLLPPVPGVVRCLQDRTQEGFVMALPSRERNVRRLWARAKCGKGHARLVCSAGGEAAEEPEVGRVESGQRLPRLLARVAEDG
jgi:hypothetical protein